MTRASLRMRNPKVIYSVVSTTRDFDAFDETALELYKKLNIHPGTVVHNAFTNIAEANQRARDLLRAAYFDGSGKNPMERLERVEEVITYENGCLTMKEYPLINKQDGSRYPYMVNVNAVQITRTQNPPVVKSQTQPKPKVPNNQAPTPTSKPLTKAERKQANKEKQAEQQRLAQERRRKRQEELQSANSKRQNSARKSRSARPAQHTDSSFIPDTLPTTQASPDSGHPTKPLTAYKLIKAVCFVGRDSDSVDEADLGGTSINSWYLDKANAFEALVKEVIVAPKIVGTRTPNTFFIQYDVDEGLAYWINDMDQDGLCTELVVREETIQVPVTWDESQNESESSVGYIRFKDCGWDDNAGIFEKSSEGEKDKRASRDKEIRKVWAGLRWNMLDLTEERNI